MSDARLRDAHRAWLQGGPWEPYHAARVRLGLSPDEEPDFITNVVAAEEVLRVWPKTKRGGRKAADKLTYPQARNVIHVYLASEGWKPKLPSSIWNSAADSEGYVLVGSSLSAKLLPKGFPEERDPPWRPIQFGGMISPDFNEHMAWGAREVYFYEWHSLEREGGYMWRAKLHHYQLNQKTYAYRLLLAALRGLDCI